MQTTLRGVLDKWFQDIMHQVVDAETLKQRRKKTRVNYEKNKKAAVRNLTDATLTYHQNEYPNVNAESVIGKVLGGGALMKNCFDGNPRAQVMLQDRVNVLFKPRPTDEKEARAFDRAVAEFEVAFGTTGPQLAEYLEALGARQRSFFRDASAGFETKILDAQRDFLAKVHIPPDLLQELKQTVTSDAEWDSLLRLVTDAELEEKLSALGVPENSAAKTRFLQNRVATFGAELSAELQKELQYIFPDTDLRTVSNMDKCLVTLFYNIKKALLQVRNSSDTTGAFNVTKLRIPKGIDRSRVYGVLEGVERASRDREYRSLVRPERAKVAARRAIHMFSSGLELMRLGLSQSRSEDKRVQAQAFQNIARGYAMVYNVTDRAPQASEEPERRQGESTLGARCPLFKESTYLPPKRPDAEPVVHRDEIQCRFFYELRECAASAVLLMFMEIMDYALNPSPPLMLRVDMRVTALYVNPSTGTVGPFGDEDEYGQWPPHKQQAFLAAHDDYIKRYTSVGFRILDERTRDGLPKLNLSKWGDPESRVVVNPFRVHEDTWFLKYFGLYRPIPNRLHIGQRARVFWLQHTIEYEFDPTYCAAFSGRQEKFPRPIFDPNFYDPENALATGRRLYQEAVSTDSKVQDAYRRYLYINKFSVREWARLQIEQKLWEPAPPEAKRHVNPSLENLPELKGQDVTREALVLKDIQENWVRPEPRPGFEEGKEYRMLAWDEEKTRRFQPYGPGESEDRPDQIAFNPVWWAEHEHAPGYVAWPEAPAGIDRDRPFPPGYSEEEEGKLYAWLPRSAFTPAPPLFDWVLDPVRFEEIPVITDATGKEHLPKDLTEKPDWLVANEEAVAGRENRTQRAFPYPIDTLSGRLVSRAPVVPAGFLVENQSRVNVATSIYVMFPSFPEFWDLRNSLLHFMRSDPMQKLVVDLAQALHSSSFDAEFRGHQDNMPLPGIKAKMREWRAYPVPANTDAEEVVVEGNDESPHAPMVRGDVSWIDAEEALAGQILYSSSS